MCGRFCCSLNHESIKEKLHKDNITTEKDVTWVDQEKYHSSYNVCPTRYVITMLDNGKTKKLKSMKWGYVPAWSRHDTMARPINARVETLAEKSMYDGSKSKRCIIITEGFYEWKKLSANKKQPHYVKRKDGELMVFAGLYDENKYFETEDDKILTTCTIITTPASKFFSSVHNRMPVILNKNDIATWINNDINWDNVVGLLKPFDGQLDFYQVSDQVGNVNKDSPDFIVPVDSKKSSISYFLKQQDPKLKFEKDIIKKEEDEKNQQEDHGASSSISSGADSISSQSSSSQKKAHSSGKKRRASSIVYEFKETKKKKKEEKSTPKLTSYFFRK